MRTTNGGAFEDPYPAHDPYLEVFGRFWDGMAFLVASIGAMRDLAGAEDGSPRLAEVGGLLEALRSGEREWPRGFLVWQSLAHTIVEAHGLLDEYVRACFELLALSEAAAALGPAESWEPGDIRRVRGIEEAVRRESERFEQLTLWRRLSRLRSRFGLEVVRIRALDTALVHHRRIRNAIVHGQLTPHVIMPDGTVGRMREYPPPPYVPLGVHVVRGAMSVLLAAHKNVDAAMTAHLGVPEDPVTAALIDEQIERGREHWLVDPWEPHPEHLFSAAELRALRPAT